MFPSVSPAEKVSEGTPGSLLGNGLMVSGLLHAHLSSLASGTYHPEAHSLLCPCGRPGFLSRLGSFLYYLLGVLAFTACQLFLHNPLLQRQSTPSFPSLACSRITDFMAALSSESLLSPIVSTSPFQSTSPPLSQALWAETCQKLHQVSPSAIPHAATHWQSSPLTEPSVPSKAVPTGLPHC